MSSPADHKEEAPSVPTVEACADVFHYIRPSQRDVLDKMLQAALTLHTASSPEVPRSLLTLFDTYRRFGMTTLMQRVIAILLYTQDSFRMVHVTPTQTDMSYAFIRGIYNQYSTLVAAFNAQLEARIRVYNKRTLMVFGATQTDYEMKGYNSVRTMYATDPTPTLEYISKASLVFMEDATFIREVFWKQYAEKILTLPTPPLLLAAIRTAPCKVLTLFHTQVTTHSYPLVDEPISVKEVEQTNHAPMDETEE